jgi:hypothetical protein
MQGIGVALRRIQTKARAKRCPANEAASGQGQCLTRSGFRRPGTWSLQAEKVQMASKSESRSIRALLIPGSPSAYLTRR